MNNEETGANGGGPTGLLYASGRAIETLNLRAFGQEMDALFATGTTNAAFVTANEVIDLINDGVEESVVTYELYKKLKINELCSLFHLRPVVLKKYWRPLVAEASTKEDPA